MRKRLWHKIAAFVLITCLVLSSAAISFADSTTAANDTATASSSSSSASFTVVKVDYPEENLASEESGAFDAIGMRYADDKTPIALSGYYDGQVFATIPTENANRKVEAYNVESKTFNDAGQNENDGYAFYVMGRLGAKGVITGDDKGNANISANITRAEATAIIMRMIGVDKLAGTDSGFTDVASNAWYAQVVTKAKELGIVKGDSETTFSPNRDVSRQEMVTMIARAVWCADLQDEKTDVQISDFDQNGYAKDASSVAEWARSAYALMQYYATMDVEPTDEVDSEGMPEEAYMYYPTKSCTRGEASEMILMAIDRFQVYPSKTAEKYGFDKQMPKIDGSTATYPFTQAIYGALFTNGDLHKDMPASHSKSHASYEKLINGEIDAMFAAIYPAEDILALAKEKNVELELIPISYDAMVFFTNKDNPATNLTTEQITDIYVNNKYSNWKDLGGTDALLYPYARNYDSGSHAQMEKYFLNGKDINSAIRQETTSVSMENVLTDVMDAETTNPTGYGLGYSIYYFFNNMDLIFDTKTNLKLLSINGVAPTDETIADGTYPLSNYTYLVIRKDSAKDSPQRKLAEYMLSDEGQQCVENAGYGKLK